MRPALDQCGTCTLCLDACPTGALVEPYVLDSTRCLSYLTIELKGPIPGAASDAIGEHAYGCDICQEVCPWNLSPAVADIDGSGVAAACRAGRSAAARPVAADRTTSCARLLKGSAMKRAGVRRLRRNLAVAIGNSGDREAIAALAAHREPTCADPLVAEHVAWAVEKLGG